jgi:histidinol dehydrogenase
MIKVYRYPGEDIKAIFTHNYLEKEDIALSVRSIIKDVRQRGDQAVFDYTLKFDRLQLNKDNIAVSKEEIEQARRAVPPNLMTAIKKAAKNISDYQLKQKSSDNIHTGNGIATGALIRPLKRAGIYVPGGTAAYPSSVLMTALVAKAAGVKEIIMCSPNLSNPLTLAAAAECGVERVYRVGGAQAVAAMAHGTESIPKVDVIAGPGNIYVTLAKKELFGTVKIDMTAGPSEIAIVADESARADIVAADMLGQAEHDELSAAYLVTDSPRLADEVQIELERQTGSLARAEIIKKSLQNNGAVILVKNMRLACEVADIIAPEHLEIICRNAEEYAEQINNAGAIFIGEYSPEALGDYFAGPSHVLPTSGSARFFQALNTDTFCRKMSYIKYDKEQFYNAAPYIYDLATAEGFGAHANSVKIRIPQGGQK